MLFKTRNKEIGKTLYKSRPLLLTAQQGYTRPSAGAFWFSTTTTVWRVDELIKRRVRDWKRLMGEDGHTGTRAGTMRKDHDSVYTATHSVFPAPLVEWIILRYGGAPGTKIIDAFAGGPPRGVVAGIMGMDYMGVEIRQEQIDENLATVKRLGISGANYALSDGRYMDLFQEPVFDMALTCPPYFNLEIYSQHKDDISNMASYAEFNAAMYFSAEAHYRILKPGAFACIVVGPFRDKRTSELIDFPAHTVENFREAGFLFWQQIVLSKNFGSAAKRSTNAWAGKKLVPIHEFLQVFRKPENAKS